MYDIFRQGESTDTNILAIEILGGKIEKRKISGGPA